MLTTLNIINALQSHVCVQQTAIDLMSRGYDVHIVADATSSREMTNRLLAFEVSIRLLIVLLVFETSS